jgi:hypothetical protein
VGYYDLLDHWVGDYVNTTQLKAKLDEMGITEYELWNMVYKKLDPIIEQVKQEFESTEEHSVQKKHKAILEKHWEEKKKFEEKYGTDTYEYCYDVFGQLRNEEYLRKLEQQYKRQQESRKQSSYHSYSKGNYNYSGSYYINQQSNYTEDEKEKLKLIYRALSKTFHPDITKDNGEMMKFINKLKEEWGL